METIRLAATRAARRPITDPNILLPPSVYWFRGFVVQSYQAKQ
jgi:hypothetical protein